MPNTILLVDDDEITCQSIESILVKKGYDVVTAANGAVALRMIPDYAPSLIFLAAHMPVMDGLTFLRYYSQLPGLQAPIVLLSGKDDTLSRALALRSHGYLEKPVQQEKLLLLLKRYLR